MKRNPRLLLILLAFSSVAISSCSKDDNESSTTAVTCLLAKAHYFDGTSSSPSDSLVYIYTNDKITKMTNNSGYATLEYASDKVIKRTFFDPASSDAVAYDTVSYNDDGSLSALKTYFLGIGPPILFAQYSFTYNNGKLSKLDSQQFDLDSARLKLIASSTFTYAGQNITQSVNTYYDPTGPTDVITANYSYDNNPNFFVKSNALFTDYIFADGIDGSIVPLLTSSNNVTKIIGPDEIIVSYTVDKKNNFTEFYFDGELASRYFYNCK